MNIILISASLKGENSTTYNLSKHVLKWFEDSTNVEEIMCSGNSIKFCTGCGSCYKKLMTCPLKDDVSSIIEKILEADGIIFATPNYLNHITGSLKALLDRTSHFIHCKRLLGKYVTAVVSSGSGQNESVLEYIKYYANQCGAQYLDGVSAQLPINEETLAKAEKIGDDFKTSIQNMSILPDQMAVILSGIDFYRERIKMRSKEWPGEYNYWVENNWLSDYKKSILGNQKILP